MAKDENITTRFKVDITDFKKGVLEAGKQIKLFNSEFKASTDGTKSWENSIVGVTNKIKQLKDILSVQQGKMQAYKDELATAEKYEKEATANVLKLREALKQATDEYGKDSDEVKKYKEELLKAEKEEKKMSDQVRRISTTMNNFQGDINKTTSEIKKYEGQLAQSKKSSGFFKESLQNLSNVAVSVAKQGLTMLLDKLKDIAKESINVGKTFDTAMSEVKAISGASGKQYDALRKKAKEMGASTKFTATESAQAFKYMAMAGWNSNKMLKSIKGVMNLAAASGEDLATTSDIVTDSLTAFGLSADKCDRFVDVLAKTATSSNTDVKKMGETFKYVAPVAGQFGYKVEDVAVGIGLMANSGIKSAKAGTTLRSVFTRLATNAGETKNSMGALSILTKKLGVAFYNADGTMRPFGKILEELRPKWQKLSTEQQANYSKTIAGQNALSGFNAMLNASDEDFQKLTKSINNSDGAAEEMSKTMQDNLEGDLQKSNSSLESLQLTLYEKVEPALRQTTKALTTFTTDLNNAFNQKDTSAMLDGLNGIADKIIEKINLIEIIDKVRKKVDEFFDKLFEEGNFVEVSVKFAKLVGKLMLSGFMLVGTFLGGGLIAGVLWGAIAGGFQSLFEKLDSVVNFSGIWETIKTFFTELPGKISGFFGGIWNAISTFFTQLPGKISGFFVTLWNSISTFLSELPNKIGFALGFLIGKVAKFFYDIIQLAITEVPKFISNVVNFFTQLPGKIYTFLANAILKVIWFAGQIKAKAIQIGTSFINNIVNFIKNLPSRVYSFLTSTISKVVTFASNFGKKALEAGKTFVTNITNKVKELPGKMLEIGTNIVKGIWNGIKDMKGWILDKISSFKDGVIDGFKKGFGIKSPSRVMKNIIGKNIGKGVAIGIKNETKTVVKAVNSMIKGTITTAKSTLQNSGFETVSKNVISKFNSTIETYVKDSNTYVKNVISTQLNNYQKTIRNKTQKIASNVKKKTSDINKTTYKQISKINASTTKKINKVNNNKKLTKKEKKQQTASLRESAQRQINAVKNSAQKQKNALKDQQNNYKTATKNITKAYSNVLSKFQKDAKNLVNSTMTNLTKKYEERYKKIVDSYNSMKDKLSGFGNVYSQTGDLIVLNDLKEQTKEITNYANTLKKLKGKVSSDLFDYVASLDVKVGQGISERLLSMSSKDLKEYDNAYKTKLSTATKLTDSIYKKDIENLNKEYNKAVDASLKNINKKLEKMGKESIKGFVSGMKTQTKGLGSDVKSIANSIVKQFKKALKIKSPSKVFANSVGKFIPSGIALGIKDNVSTLYKDIKNLSNGIVNASGSMISNLHSKLPTESSNSIANNQTYNFYQTNNSPEPLSRIDIYNQTRKQLDFARMVINNA